MPTTIKQLKVINNSKLAPDGTFSIGLRDNLVIKPNAKVGLSKFLYEEVFPSGLITLPATEFDLTTQLRPTLTADRTTPRKVSIPAQVAVNSFQLLAEMEKEANSVLVCGDKTGSGKTFSDYIIQDKLKPLSDAGLDIVFTMENDDVVNFSYSSFKNQMCVNDIFSNTNFFQDMSIVEAVESQRGDLGLVANATDSWWGYSDGEQSVKGAIQTYIQPTILGNFDWSWGLRYFTDETSNNDAPVRMGIYKSPAPDNDFYLVDRGNILPDPIAYTWTEGDFFVMFSAGGDLYLQIYNGLPNGNGITGAVGVLKYTSPVFSLYNELLGSADAQYRMCIASGDDYGLTEDAEELPTFRQIYSTWRNYDVDTNVTTPNGALRIVQMDMTNSGELPTQFALNKTQYTSPKYQTQTTFVGASTPNFYRVQDISLFWSLPAHTYVGSQDKTRNTRENLIASFTPSRQETSTNNLFFQEEISYTDIGNLDTMNISTLQFRLINEYPAYKTQLNTNYLAFTLFIKEESY